MSMTIKQAFQKLTAELGANLRNPFFVGRALHRACAEIADDIVDGGITPEEMEAVTGKLTDLTTTAKTNLVAAINEVNGIAGDIGDLDDLTTTAKTTLVAAVNEVNAIVADKGSVKVTGDGVKTYAATLAELFALVDYTKVTRDTYLIDGNLIGQLMCNRPDTHELTFVSCTGNVFYNYTVGSATSAVRTFRLSDQSYVDLSTAVVTNGVELVIHY